MALPTNPTDGQEEEYLGYLWKYTVEGSSGYWSRLDQAGTGTGSTFEPNLTNVKDKDILVYNNSEWYNSSTISVAPSEIGAKPTPIFPTIDNCVVHLDSNGSQFFTKDANDRISSWLDISGNGNNFIAVSENASNYRYLPLFTQSPHDSEKFCVKMGQSSGTENTNDYSCFKNNMVLPNNSTIFIVFDVQLTSYNHYISIMSASNYNGSGSIMVYSDAAADNAPTVSYLQPGNTNAYNKYSTVKSSHDSTVPMVFGINYNNTSLSTSEAANYIMKVVLNDNNIIWNEKNTTSSYNISKPLNGISLGCYYTEVAGYQQRGNLYEYLVYDRALNDTEWGQVQTYLYNKWVL